MTERRCHGCRVFYDATLRACPDCGTPKHAHNTWLARANMNSALWAQTERAVREQ
jgi:rRNA maturation endonuclease Nob1